MGYTVDYTQADQYDGSNMNNGISGCCAPSGRRQLRQQGPPLNNPNKKPLSDAGREKAFAYGRKQLKDNALPPGLALPDDVTYVGDKIISVLIIEDGEVYEVSVGA